MHSKTTGVKSELESFRKFKTNKINITKQIHYDRGYLIQYVFSKLHKHDLLTF